VIDTYRGEWKDQLKTVVYKADESQVVFCLDILKYDMSIAWNKRIFQYHTQEIGYNRAQEIGYKLMLVIK